MAFFKEFKQFALKGNVMDMAVGVIIGGAFGKIVSSFVNDILMPPIGALIGNTDFSQLRLDISKLRDATSHAVQAVGDVVAAGDAVIAPPAAEPIYWNYGGLHPAVRRLHDPGLLRLSDGQADEPDRPQEGGGPGTRSGTRPDKGGAAAYGDPRPTQGAAETVGPWR